MSKTKKNKKKTSLKRKNMFHKNKEKTKKNKFIGGLGSDKINKLTLKYKYNIIFDKSSETMKILKKIYPTKSDEGIFDDIITKLITNLLFTFNKYKYDMISKFINCEINDNCKIIRENLKLIIFNKITSQSKLYKMNDDDKINIENEIDNLVITNKSIEQIKNQLELKNVNAIPTNTKKRKKEKKTSIEEIEQEKITTEEEQKEEQTKEEQTKEEQKEESLQEPIPIPVETEQEYDKMVEKLFNEFDNEIVDYNEPIELNKDLTDSQSTSLDFLIKLPDPIPVPDFKQSYTTNYKMNDEQIKKNLELTEKEKKRKLLKIKLLNYFYNKNISDSIKEQIIKKMTTIDNVLIEERNILMQELIEKKNNSINPFEIDIDKSNNTQNVEYFNYMTELMNYLLSIKDYLMRYLNNIKEKSTPILQNTKNETITNIDKNYKLVEIQINELKKQINELQIKFPKWSLSKKINDGEFEMTNLSKSNESNYDTIKKKYMHDMELVLEITSSM